MVGLEKQGTSMTVGEILSATGGALLKGVAGRSLGVSIDSRTLQAGELFIAIQGERFDGHHFVGEAIAKSARGVVIRSDRVAALEGIPLLGEAFAIGVADTLRALQDIALFHRRRFELPIVAVTGSNGKTTTKEMIASILQERWRVLRNQGNLNNQIGVPLTLLQLEQGHQAAVIEMGISHKGELRRLCEVALPTLGVITNIGPAHLETLGSLEGVAEAKGELLDGLREGSLFALNEEDPLLRGLVAGRKGLRFITFGLERGADLVGQEITINPARGERFRLMRGGDGVEISLPLFGHHHVLNAVAASAIATGLGFSLEEIRCGLEKVQGVGMRMEVCDLDRGIRVINDAYNANPDSMRAALASLLRMRGKGGAVAVLGDMLELGRRSSEAHREMGRFVGRGGIDFLITVGEQARFIAEGAREVGMGEERIRTVDHVTEASQRLLECLKGGEWVLVKGSRRMEMERIMTELMKAEG